MLVPSEDDYKYLNPIIQNGMVAVDLVPIWWSCCLTCSNISYSLLSIAHVFSYFTFWIRPINMDCQLSMSNVRCCRYSTRSWVGSFIACPMTSSSFCFYASQDFVSLSILRFRCCTIANIILIISFLTTLHNRWISESNILIKSKVTTTFSALVSCSQNVVNTFSLVGF